MKNFVEKHKVSINISLFFLSWVLVFVFLAYPMIRKIVNDADEMERQRIEEKLNQEKVLKIPEMEQKLSLFKNKETEMKTILEPEKEVAFINSLEAVANETGNKISLKVDDKVQVIKQEKKTKDEAAKTDILSSLPYNNFILIEVDLEGRYDSLLNFIKKLENFDVPVNVIAINLLKNQESKAMQVFSAERTVETAGSVQIEKSEFLKSTLNLAVYIKKK
ncbi:MAG: hypothetical protein NTZ97_01055 [Candidatus Moranbacteria bacterium]|nr:hypothetical protein [Candidatus Moranbacteria bacterium]